MDNAAGGAYPNTVVPVEKRGSAIPLFFVVTGTLCSFPVLLLSGDVANAFGFPGVLYPFILGALMAGILAGLTSYCGSKAGCNTAMLVERTFGPQGGLIAKIMVSFSLIGWYLVIASLLGTTLSVMSKQLWGLNLSPSLLAAGLVILVALIVARGVRGLEVLGYVLVPLTAAILIYAFVSSSSGSADQPVATSSMTLGAGISAVIGIYIAGIVIQPDFSRFVRAPRYAALASATALAVGYPIILIVAGISALNFGKANVVEGLSLDKVGSVVMAIVLGGALIDSSLSLYSGSVGLANLLRLKTNRMILVIAVLLGLLLSFIPIEGLFIRYLTILGIALPPLAVTFICDNLWAGSRNRTYDSPIRLGPLLVWAAGVVAGALTLNDVIVITGISSLDSILVSGVMGLVMVYMGHRSARLSATH